MRPYQDWVYIQGVRDTSGSPPHILISHKAHADQREGFSFAGFAIGSSALGGHERTAPNERGAISDVRAAHRRETWREGRVYIPIKIERQGRSWS